MMYIVCVIIRLENLYIREFCEHYLSLGFSKCVVYDNNFVDGENPIPILSDFINEGYVDVIDFRGLSECQHIAYNDCLERYSDTGAWILFVDCDEFLVLNNHKTIGDYMDDIIPSTFRCVKFNWKCYGDSDLVRYDNRNVMDRFTIPFEKDFNIFGYKHNRLCKSMVKCGQGLEYTSLTSHNPMKNPNNALCCNSDGTEELMEKSLTGDIHWGNAQINHYVTKTIEEFIKYKAIRGYPDKNTHMLDFFSAKDMFFIYPNLKTDKKVILADNIINRYIIVGF